MRGRADGANRLVVVHAERAEQADGAERAVREPVGGADEREVAERGMLELVAHPDERAARVERAREDVEECCTLLEDLEHVPVRGQLLSVRPREQRRRASDVHTLIVGCELREDRADRVEERALALRKAAFLEAPPQHRRARLEPRQPFVQVLPRPYDEALVEWLVEGERALRDAARGGD